MGGWEIALHQVVKAADGTNNQDSEEENGSGNCKTSGDQVTCDVRIGVSPPNSQFKITGCFWRKNGKRLESTKSGLNSKYVSRDGNEQSSSSSKTSFASIPPTPQSEGEILQSANLRSFSFSVLKIATRNFRPDRMLGKGGSGSVFEGWIDENTYTATKRGTGIAVAVKRLNEEWCAARREWLEQVNYLGQLDHPNLVKLIGYCAEDEHRLLVTEFVSHGNLGYHLFRRGTDFEPLSWNLRMKVALGAAKGLAFLHSAETYVHYRDFKTSNILLDSAYNVKLSNSGLVKGGLTRRALFAYERAPEYLSTGRLNARSSTYSFGVLFLEMLSGQKATDVCQQAGEQDLIEWDKPYILSSKARVLRVIDTGLEGQYTQAEALKAANLATECLSVDPRCRPTMEKVVASLEGLQDSNEHAITYHSDQNPNQPSYPWPPPDPFYAR